MCHFPPSYVFVEDADRVRNIVIAGGGGGERYGVLATISGPFNSGCFASGECAASEARVELARGIETLGVDLQT